MQEYIEPFKSDRGGIEIDSTEAEIIQAIKFKSDRGGIEIWGLAGTDTQHITVQIRPWRD